MSKTHNHSHCIESALKRARRLCVDKKLRFTSIRQRVLELVWSDHQPSKAYDILDRVRVTHPSAKPPTVYRALDFLLEHGLVHKLNSLNAYVGCAHPNREHFGFFMICRECSEVQEFSNDTIDKGIVHAARARSFARDEVALEVFGLCQYCRKASA